MSSHAIRLRLLAVLVVSMFALVAFGCSDDDDNPVAPTPLPFSGDYAMQHWTESGITGGTTSCTPDSGATATAVFAYNVHLLAGDGVTRRTARFEVPVPKSGVVSFNWSYAGYHAFCCPATAYLRVYADGDEYLPINNRSASGGFTFSGTAAINVSEGGILGFEIGGQNYDSDSQLQGTLTITNFKTP